MSFYSVVTTLVQIHDDEVRKLQQQIASLLELDPAKGHEFVTPPEAHHRPLDESLSAAPRKTPPWSHRSSLRVSDMIEAHTPKQNPPWSHGSSLDVMTPRDASPRNHMSYLGASGVAISSTVNEAKPASLEHSDTEDLAMDGSKNLGCDTCLDSIPEQKCRNMFVSRWARLAKGLVLGQCPDRVVYDGWKLPDGSDDPVLSKSISALTLTKNVQKKAYASWEMKIRQRRVSWGTPGPIWASWGTALDSKPLPACQVVAHPLSRRTRAWGTLTAIVILYEFAALTMTPFEIFDTQDKKFLDLASAAFWCVDIAMNFLTGFYSQGKAEMRVQIIAKRYLLSWFVFDFTIASAQVVTLFQRELSWSTPAFMVKLMRVMRSLRIGRTVAWMKKSIKTYCTAHVSVLSFRFGECFVVLYAFVHINACLYYEAGKSDSGWVSDYERMMDTTGGKYCLAMQWSLSQLQGNTEIFPGTGTDLVFALVSSFASIIFLALLVSFTTESLVAAHQEVRSLTATKHTIDDFFSRHDVPLALRERAEFYLRHQQAAQHFIRQEDRDRQALAMFPPKLRLRLLGASRAPVIMWHPVFSFLQEYCFACFVNVCAEALVWHACEPEDDVFEAGTRSTCAYYIVSGNFVFNSRTQLLGIISPWLDSVIAEIGASRGVSGNSFVRKSLPNGIRYPSTSRTSRYSIRTRASAFSTMDDPSYHEYISQKHGVERLRERQCICEVALWMRWVHVGNMCASEHGQCFAIASSNLLSVVMEHPQAHQVLSSYAMRFATVARHLRDERVSDKFVELMGFETVFAIEDEIDQKSTRNSEFTQDKECTQR